LRTSRLSELLPAETREPAGTQQLGRSIGLILERGDIVALFGELGSGKTILTRGILEGLGGDPTVVTSPTFTLVHEYTASTCPVYHFDLYRVETPGELFDLGYEDYFFGSGVCVIEWPERAGDLLPPATICLRIEPGPGDRRMFVAQQ
jgi:tRNA threonylcarbamoyladenosine biosynthesis protein TsaE